MLSLGKRGCLYINWDRLWWKLAFRKQQAVLPSQIGFSFIVPDLNEWHPCHAVAQARNLGSSLTLSSPLASVHIQIITKSYLDTFPVWLLSVLTSDFLNLFTCMATGLGGFLTGFPASSPVYLCLALHILAWVILQNGDPIRILPCL